ncbi:MAG: type II toxin-antitoxin system HicB family antitoxin [candidate division NC10 bacterium]|nr:type II toxin-antitoxin system HicB family antitoxin [candidate division NC10 bacterium]
MNCRYRAWFERDEDGGYSVWVPALPGCESQGDTLEEAAANIREAIQCYLQSSLKHGEAIPDDSKMVEGRVEVPFNTEVAERAAEVPV